MAIVKVNPGICGLLSTIDVQAPDGMNAEIKVATECPYIKALGDAVSQVNGYTEVFAKYGDGAIALAAKEHCEHSACPVPTAILKGVEVVCSLALPKNVEISIEK